MSRPIEFQNHPFRFLLYLEWILLAIAALTETIPVRHSLFPQMFPYFPQLKILSLAIFGLMGLKLPTSKQIYKILYTVCQIILILLIADDGRREIRLFPFFYIIVVIRSCLMFEMPGRLAVTGFTFTIFLIGMIHRFQHLQVPPRLQERFKYLPLSIALLVGISLVFVLLLMNTLIAERQSREKLAIANEKLREYALRIEDQATLQERNRIAREIHDSLGHSLTALNLQLETALKLWQSNPTKAQSFLARAKELGSKALQDVRHSVSTMRSNPLQGLSLKEAITVLTRDFQRSTGVLPICIINLLSDVPNEVNTAVYRIVQESLTNIYKYANATEVKLELTATKTSLELMIRDNGRGFDLGQNTTGFGLQSMRDRTLALGGIFNINSAPGCGCKIKVDIPLSRST
jgi:signal transduction histidine kinase